MEYKNHLPNKSDKDIGKAHQNQLFRNLKINELPGGSVLKNLPAYAGDMSSIPGSRSSPGERHGNPL